MEAKIKDIRAAINNGTYYCALALALTLPDICCQVENCIPYGKNSDRHMYIAWVNSHLPAEDFEPPVSGFTAQTFGGEMCYSLRCKVLHNGITDVNNQGLGVSVDSFKLTFPGDDDYYHGYRYIENNSGQLITLIGIDYLCESLCNAAEQFYNAYPNKADFDLHSF